MTEFLNASTGEADKKTVKLLGEAAHAYFEGNCTEYYAISKQIGHRLEPHQLELWLERSFRPDAENLIRESLREEDDLDASLSLLAMTAEIISGCDSVRIYLVDSTEERLVCRHTTNDRPFVFMKDSISVASPKWALAKAYSSPERIDIEDAQDPMVSCDREAAQEGRIKSCVILPMYLPQGRRACAGLLCMDWHKPGFPKGGKERNQQTEHFLERIADVVVKIKIGFDRRDELKRGFLIERMGKFLLPKKRRRANVEKILHTLYSVVESLQPHIEMMIVRVERSNDRDQRLSVAGYWPPELKPILQSPELNVIKVEESFLANVTINRFYAHCPLSGAHKGNALQKFRCQLANQKIAHSVRSMHSFPLIFEGRLFGTCNFYSSTDREFDAGELATLSLLVNSAAVGLLDRMRLAELEKRQDGLEFLGKAFESSPESTKTDASEQDGWEEAARTVFTEMARAITEKFHFSQVSLVASRFHFSGIATQDKNKESPGLTFDYPEEKPEDQLRFEPARIVLGRRDPQLQVISRHGDPSLWTQYCRGLSKDTAFCIVVPIREKPVDGENPVDDRAESAVILECDEQGIEDKIDLELLQNAIQVLPLLIHNTQLQNSLRERKEFEDVGRAARLILHSFANSTAHVPKLCTRALEKMDLEDFAAVRDSLADILEVGSELEELNVRLSDAAKKERKDCEILSVQDYMDHFREWIKGSVLGKEFKRYGIALMVSRFSGDEKIKADTFYLDEILKCLVDNGCSACKKLASESRKKRVSVEVSARGGMIVFQVKDNGIGIDPNISLKELCREPITAHGEEGKGVGLWIVGSFAERMKGWVGPIQQSEAESGALFELHIPIAE